jgi:hypothetical protein
MTSRRNLLMLVDGGLKLTDTTVVETKAPADERTRIWQTYRAGGLHVEAATAQLLRLDIDSITLARERVTRLNIARAAAASS